MYDFIFLITIYRPNLSQKFENLFCLFFQVCKINAFKIQRLGNGGGGPPDDGGPGGGAPGGLDGKLGGGPDGGGPDGLPGKGGGALFLGGAGISLLGVFAADDELEDELFELSLDNCLGGGPVGLIIKKIIFF